VNTAKLTLIAAIAAGSAGALAQTDAGWYLGTGLVPPKPRPELVVPPHPSEPREVAEPGFQQFGGYRFTRNWSVDFGYAGSSQSNAWTFAGSGLLPIGRSFSLQGRLGLAVPTTEFSLSSAAGALSSVTSMDAARARSNLLWGFGGQYDFNPNVGLRMDFNSRYGEDAAANRARNDLWSINAVVRF
jgi:hypothetical protein